MKQGLRPRGKFNYKLYHSDGVKVAKSTQVQETSKFIQVSSDADVVLNSSAEGIAQAINTSMAYKDVDDPINNLTIEESILVDDIADFLEENESTSYQESIEDIEDCIKRVEGFRTQYRRKHKELKMHLNELYEGTYQKAYNLTIGNLKEFVMKKKNSKRSLRASEDLGDREAIEMRKRKMKFLLSEAERAIVNLQKSFTLPLIQDDLDIKKRKDELPHQLKQLQMLSVSMKDIIETGLANGRAEESFDELNKR
eukprot:gene3821-4352_t